MVHGSGAGLRGVGRRAVACAASISTLFLAAVAPLADAAEPAPVPLADVNVIGVDGDKDYHPARSSTATKTDTPLKEIPASITVVPAQLIRDASLLSIGDVLRYVPGVMMHQGENNRDDVALRGNRTNADFFVNGVRDDAQVFRDVYNLERVEVLKGPAGVIFGRGGAGGIIKRVTKRPVFGAVGDV
jgi:catecholate siderophore receptor